MSYIIEEQKRRSINHNCFWFDACRLFCFSKFTIRSRTAVLRMLPERRCLAFIFKGRSPHFSFLPVRCVVSHRGWGAYGKFRRCITTVLRRLQSRQRAGPCTPKKRKDGRLLNDNRTEILSFRGTPEEKETITEKALSFYRLVSIYLRDCALGKKSLR